MKPITQLTIVIVAITLAASAILMAQQTTPAPATSQPAPTTAPEVTLKGVMMTEASCIPNPTPESAKTFVLFAVQGPPEVDAIVEDIVKKNCPGEGMNADQAKKINDEFESRLKYYITPCDFTAKKDNVPRYRNPAMAVTGVIVEKDGRKWITPSKFEKTALKYPDKLDAVDKPQAMPAKDPLVLKINDTLSLKCILLPAGRYLERVPFYSAYSYDGSQMRYDDDYPRIVTLTKPFYLAEIPVTQEMFEALIGNNPSGQKGPQIAVTQAPCLDVNKFCQILSEKTQRTVRLPTPAEREYAARVGSSSPSCNANYQDQLSVAPDGKSLLPVKSKKPNAWGLYDMFGCVWEMTGCSLSFHRTDESDPFVPCKNTKGWGNHAGLGRNAFSWTTSREGVSDGTGTGYFLTTFRVAVDATPEEISKMAKDASSPQN